METLRVCRVCGLKAFKNEDLELFTRHQYSKHGYANICKKCGAEYKKGWFARQSKDRIRESNKKWKQRLRLKVLSLYGNKCVCCGETHIEFLSIDHIAGGGREEYRRLGGTYNVYVHVRDLFLNDSERALKTYRILCYNCNFSIGHYGYCPHKSPKHL